MLPVVTSDTPIWIAMKQKPTTWEAKPTLSFDLMSARLRHDLRRHSLPRPYLIQLSLKGETRAHARDNHMRQR